MLQYNYSGGDQKGALWLDKKIRQKPLNNHKAPVINAGALLVFN